MYPKGDCTIKLNQQIPHFLQIMRSPFPWYNHSKKRSPFLLSYEISFMIIVVNQEEYFIKKGFLRCGMITDPISSIT